MYKRKWEVGDHVERYDYRGKILKNPGVVTQVAPCGKKLEVEWVDEAGNPYEGIFITLVAGWTAQMISITLVNSNTTYYLDGVMPVSRICYMEDTYATS